MPIHKKDGGEQWGNHGKVYHGPGAKKKAEEQAAAAHANGFHGDAEEDDETRELAEKFKELDERRNKLDRDSKEYKDISDEMDRIHHHMEKTRNFKPGGEDTSEEEISERTKREYERGHPQKQAEAIAYKELAGDSQIGEGVAMDRASLRRMDADGRLHVQVSNISKATVNPYLGSEIPNWQSLGLDPDRVYQLLRDPGELALAAPTFNNIPLLSQHVPVSADEPRKDIVVGSTGTDAVFDDPYLKNSLVVWDSPAIGGIESREQYELSCAYRYTPDMTPGVYEGVPYDGVMRDIVGNHVALVEVGRAGPDVVVSDSNPFQETKMAKKASSKTIAVRAAVRAVLRPRLAADAALDINTLIGDVTGKFTEDDARKIVTSIQAKAKLAKDANLNDLHRVIMDAAESEKAEDAEEEESEEDRKKREEAEAKAAADAEEEEQRKKDEEGKAMDAAIKAASAKAEADAIKRMQAISKAEKEVQPIIGDVAAMDSAEAVYKLALDHLGIDVTDVDPSAYRAMVRMHLASNEGKKTRLAQDAAKGGDWMSENFPHAAPLVRI